MSTVISPVGDELIQSQFGFQEINSTVSYFMKSVNVVHACLGDHRDRGVSSKDYFRDFWQVAGVEEDRAIVNDSFETWSVESSRLPNRPSIQVWRMYDPYNKRSEYGFAGVLTRSILPSGHVIVTTSTPVLDDPSVINVEIILDEDGNVLAKSVVFVNGSSVSINYKDPHENFRRSGIFNVLEDGHALITTINLFTSANTKNEIYLALRTARHIANSPIDSAGYGSHFEHSWAHDRKNHFGKVYSGQDATAYAARLVELAHKGLGIDSANFMVREIEHFKRLIDGAPDYVLMVMSAMLAMPAKISENGDELDKEFPTRKGKYYSYKEAIEMFKSSKMRLNRELLTTVRRIVNDFPNFTFITNSATGVTDVLFRGRYLDLAESIIGQYYRAKVYDVVGPRDAKNWIRIFGGLEASDTGRGPEISTAMRNLGGQGEE